MKSGVSVDFGFKELVNALHNPVTALPTAEIAGRIVYLKGTSEKAFYCSIDTGTSVQWYKFALATDISTALADYLKKGTKISGKQLVSEGDCELIADWNDKNGTTAGNIKLSNFPSIGGGSITINTKHTSSSSNTSSVKYNVAETTDKTINITGDSVGVGAFVDKTLTGNTASNILYNTALIGSPTAPTVTDTDNSTKIATTAFVQSAISKYVASVDAMIYKGTIAIGAYTPAADKGHTYKVVAASSGATSGTIDGLKVEVGDILICNSDSTVAATSSNYSTIQSKWDVVQGNTEGVVVFDGSGATVGNVPKFKTNDGKAIEDSGFSIAKSVPSNALFTDEHVTAVGNHYAPTGGSAATSEAASGTARTYVKQVLIDGAGHVTKVTTGTETVTNTHNVTHAYVNKDGSASDSATSASEDTKVTIYDDSTKRDSITFKGDGYTSISSTGKVITIKSDDSRTTEAGHYTPSSQDHTLDAVANSTTPSWNVPVLQEVHLSLDSKDHIIGITSTSTRIPTNPANNGKFNIQVAGVSKGTFTANQSTDLTINITPADLGVTAIPVYKKYDLTGTTGTINATGTNGHDCGANIIVQARKNGQVFLLNITVDTNGNVVWETQDSAYSSTDKVTLHIMGMKTL